jgi:hypothetical protein
MYVFLCYTFYFVAEFNAFVNFDFLLAAVFLWIMFFATALSSIFTVFLRDSAADDSFCAMLALVFFISVFNADFFVVFCIVFALDILTLFIADFIFGNPFTSCDLVNIVYFTMKGFKMQGRCPKFIAEFIT